MGLRSCRVSVLALLALLVSVPAQAGERTEVVDAFAPGNPFDFHIEPTFRQEVERGVIVREAPGVLRRAGCEPGSDDPKCNEAATELERELDYRRVINALDLDLQFGLHRNLEFHLTLPIILSDRTDLSYADGVNGDNSSIDPSDERIAADLDPNLDDLFGTAFGTYRYFDVPSDGVRRSGLGDIVVGLAWAPFDPATNRHAAALRLHLDYMAPTGKAARVDNRNVGSGTHELRLGLAASRAYIDYLEPYFAFDAAVPFAAGNGLFADPNRNSINRKPGARIDASFGSEIILLADEVRSQRYTINLGVDFGYTVQGREAGPMFDALGGSDCNGLTAGEAGYSEGTNGNVYRPGAGVTADNAACAWVVQQPGNVIDDQLNDRSRWSYAHDGIFDVEGRGRVGGHVGLHLGFNEYVGLHIDTKVMWHSPYFLSFADAGRDADGSGVVELDPAPEDGEAVERNPNYNLTFDPVGRRFRMENMVSIEWSARLAFQF